MEITLGHTYRWHATTEKTLVHTLMKDLIDHNCLERQNLIYLFVFVYLSRF